MPKIRAILAATALAAAGIFAGAAEAEPRLNTVAGYTVQVTDSGCASTHHGPYCPYGPGVRSNWYSTFYRIAVLATNQSALAHRHEACHSHQHEAVLYYLGREPSLDLREWHQTWEYAVWQYHVGNSPAPYTLSAWNQLEDWAQACAYYFTDPGRLWQLSPGRYHAIAGLFGYW